MNYKAKITEEDGSFIVEFPDCPGCLTFGDSREDAVVQAAEALEGWLESHLENGKVPPKPAARSGTDIPVNLSLAFALEVRWARDDRKLTQKGLAEVVGVKQQQIAKLERPGANPSLETVEKVFRGLDRVVTLGFAVRPKGPVVKASASDAVRPSKTKSKAKPTTSRASRTA